MTTLLVDPTRHLPLDVLRERLPALVPPRDAGTVALVVARAPHGRELPVRAHLTPQGGVPGDRWAQIPLPDAQISVMRFDVAALFANGQPASHSGDNLFVDLDLSTENLPAGARIRAGTAVLEITAKAHTGCRKFRERFGAGALALTLAEDLRPLRLRGLYARVVEAGDVGPGDPVVVLFRPVAS